MALTVKLKGNDVKLTGDIVSVGDFAPECKVVLSDLSEKTVGGKKDKFQLLIAVPSLDTLYVPQRPEGLTKRWQSLKM